MIRKLKKMNEYKRKIKQKLEVKKMKIENKNPGKSVQKE